MHAKHVQKLMTDARWL